MKNEWKWVEVYKGLEQYINSNTMNTYGQVTIHNTYCQATVFLDFISVQDIKTDTAEEARELVESYYNKAVSNA